MSTGFEAAADIATGAILARAVEPDIGADGDTHETSCLNCAAPLAGSYCSACGQKAHVHRTLIGFGHDLIHGVFHFDGKIWRTLPMLVWNPGHLTRRYIHGERAKFVSPLAVFLFTVFFTFAIFNSVIGHNGGRTSVQTPDQQTRELNAKVKRKQDAVARLEAKRAGIKDDDAERKDVESEITEAKAELRDTIRENVFLIAAMKNEKEKFDRKAQSLNKAISDLTAEIETAKKLGKPPEAIKALEDKMAGEKLALSLATRGFDAINDANSISALQDANLVEGNEALNNLFKRALQNPKLLVYKVQSNTYKFSWALIPISIPFVWLLFFWKRRFKLFDHAVFVTYSLTFMMLWSALLAIIITYEIANPVIMAPVMLYPLAHMYRQLKQAYELSWFSALWRTVLLFVFAGMALILFALLILGLGVAS
jgi:hypothetical protein